MIRILDTTPAFETFASAAGLESPFVREQMWRDLYEGAHPDVFRGFHAIPDMAPRPQRMIQELGAIRRVATVAAPVLTEMIEQVSPAVQELVGAPDEPSPLHVLLVGTGSTNAVVGKVGDEVAVFHCLEWFRSGSGSRTVIAHEVAHAWHRLVLPEVPPDDDLAWTAFSEGLAIQASRAAVPDRKEQEYFWYDIPGFDGWVEWCQAYRDELRAELRHSLETGTGPDALFGGERPEGPRRVGYFVADELVAGLGRPLPELVRLSVADATAMVREAVGAGSGAPG